MKAKILTLTAGSSAEEICKNIAQVVDTFEGKYYIERINCPYEDYCTLFTNKKIDYKEAVIIYNALDLVRQYEFDRDYIINKEKVERLDVVLNDIRMCIEKNIFYKLTKKIELMKELLYEHY